MNNENSVPIADLFDINKRVSLNLWHMANEHGQPSNLSPHVIYPLKRDRSVRISEQEARIICCGLLNNLSLYYSVETPTKQRYVQKGKKKEGMSAQTDLTMYGFDGQTFKRVINMEFKAHNCDKRDIAKDIEKLVREKIDGNWFHIFGNTNRRTMPSVFEKFKDSFLSYSRSFSRQKISIVFCFCVLQKQKAYMRHFLYQPSKHRYEEYVTDFFDSSSSNLKDNWQFFSGAIKSVQDMPIKGPGECQHENIPKAWYYWEDEDNRGYVLAFVNGKGSCSLRRFDAESGEKLERLYRKGNFQVQFAEYIKATYRLHLSHQPNLERDCKRRLPMWVLSELRPQIDNIIDRVKKKMTQHPKKLKWERVNNSFDLRVKNFGKIDKDKLIKLFEDVESSKCFHQHISAKRFLIPFKKWLEDTKRPLQGETYAVLSNWFKTRKARVPESQLGENAKKLWEALFCAVPQDRLTSPEPGENHKILPEEFALWWPRQLRCQQDC